MGFQDGNQNGVKIKDPDLRQKAYNQYCEWLSKGKSSRSFTFVEGDLMCTGQTIESYIKLYPSEFPAIKKNIAFSKGLSYWENIVDGTADGKNKQACVPALNMLMRNKYGWDKPETHEDDDKPTEPMTVAVKEMNNAATDLLAKTAHQLQPGDRQD